jgi:hypothetical protein
VHQYEPFLACCDGHLVIDEPGLDAFLRRERPALLADGRMCVVGSLRLEERGIVAVLRDLAMQRR